MKKLAPVDVKDESVLAQCRSALTAWSSKLPYAVTCKLGEEAELVSAQAYHSYSFKIETKLAHREFELMEGGAPVGDPKSIWEYDLWTIEAKSLSGELDVELPETACEENCESCHGSGRKPCPSCDGTGRERCFWCSGSGRSITGKSNCFWCKGSGKLSCSECDGSGQVVCTHCNGHGVVPKVWHLQQSQRVEELCRKWQDEGIPDSFEFCPTGDTVATKIISVSCDGCVDSGEGMKIDAPFSDKLVDDWLKYELKVGSISDTKIRKETVELIQYDALIRYEYKYRGKNYVAWIDLPHGVVFEMVGTGLFLEQAEMTAKRAAEYPWWRPQQAIGDYARAVAQAAEHTDVLGKYAAKLRGRMSVCSWAFRLASIGIGGWLWSRYLMLYGADASLGWIVVGALYVVDLLFANRKVQLSILGVVALATGALSAVSFCAAAYLPSDAAFVRHLVQCALLYSGLTLVFSRDLCLRVYGGVLASLISGAAVGFLTAPGGAIDFAADPAWMLKCYDYAVCGVWGLALIRTFSRWCAQDGGAAAASMPCWLLRLTTRGLRPGLVMTLLWALLMAAGVVVRECTSGCGVTAEMRLRGTERLLNETETVGRGRLHLSKLVEEKQIAAMSLMAELLVKGKGGFARDERKGYETALAAARQGDARGWRVVGECLEFGRGADQDPAKAHAAYLKSGELGDAAARECAARTRDIAACWTGAYGGKSASMRELAERYRRGTGIAASPSKALAWLCKAADAGDVESMFEVGESYAFGRGLARDDAKAFCYFEKAGDRGCLPAKFALGKCYEQGIGVVTNFTRALALYTEAAAGDWKSSDGMASSADAKASAQRIGTLGENWERAIGGDAAAQDAVGTCYENGTGVGKDAATAYGWYVKSAAQGNDAGIMHMADCLFSGIGTAEDKKAAGAAYAKVAELSGAAACVRFGMCCENGWGVERNLAKAYALYVRAGGMSAGSGVEEAKKIEFFRLSSAVFALTGIFDDGVELPNGLMFAGLRSPPHCDAFSEAFSALSRAISRSFAAMTSSFLSS